MIIFIPLVVICSVLNLLGGQVNKLYRRIGIPLVLTIVNTLFHGWIGLITFPIGFIAFSLPITLKGDDITSSWLNYLWLPILGFIIGLQTFSLLTACVFSLLFSALIVLSNTKKTAELFTWPRVELLYGGLLGVLTWVQGYFL